MRELGLFAGAGGGLLASLLLGWRTVCAVELDAHCQRVLAQRQRDGMLDPFPIWDDGPALENWSMRAAKAVRMQVDKLTTEVVCLAGANYAVPFAWALSYYRITCEQPLAGMPVGLRLKWLKANTAPIGVQQRSTDSSTGA